MILSFLLALSLSLDALGAGMACGLRPVCLPTGHNEGRRCFWWALVCSFSFKDAANRQTAPPP